MEVVHNINKLGLDTNRKIYECTNCGKLFNWGKESSWYGSIKDMDNGEIKYFFCSDKCQSQQNINELNK